ncbi:hypothetical protein ACLX1H_000718 [Fusarium chlamydosporum]
MLAHPLSALLRSHNVNGKRVRDDSDAQQPAKRQSNFGASLKTQIPIAKVFEGPYEVPQHEIAQSDVRHPAKEPEAAETLRPRYGGELVADDHLTFQGLSSMPTQGQEEITRRVEEYRSRLQAFEEEHKSLSQDRNPRVASEIRNRLEDAVNSRIKADTKLRQIEDVTKEIRGTIEKGRDVVPLQLHEALEASKILHGGYEMEFLQATDHENQLTKQLKDAKRKYDEAGPKLEVLNGQMDTCRLDLRSAEQDLNNVLLQHRLEELSRVNVATLSYDKRLLLSKLANQMKTAIDGESEAVPQI